MHRKIKPTRLLCYSCKRSNISTKSAPVSFPVIAALFGEYRNVKSILLILLTVVLSACSYSGGTKPSESKSKSDAEVIKEMSLKESFVESREKDNIAISLIKLWNSKVYVAVKDIGNDKVDFYYVDSQKNDRKVVTISDQKDILSRINSPRVELYGNQLLGAMDQEAEIVVMLEGGWEYVTYEQLEWIRDKTGTKKIK